MLNYHDLTAAQRHWVDLVEASFPDEPDVLTYKRLLELHAHFVSLRSVDARYKCAKPLWLITNNAISRGLYKLPKSTFIDDAEDLPLDSELEIRYREELKNLDIQFNKSK